MPSRLGPSSIEELEEDAEEKHGILTEHHLIAPTEHHASDNRRIIRILGPRPALIGPRFTQPPSPAAPTGGLLARGFADAVDQAARPRPAASPDSLSGRVQAVITHLLNIGGKQTFASPNLPGSVPTWDLSNVGRSGARFGSLLQPKAGSGDPQNGPGSNIVPPAWNPSRPFAAPSEVPARPPFKSYGEARSDSTPNSAQPSWDPTKPYAVPTPPSQLRRPPPVGNDPSSPQAKDADFRQLSRMPLDESRTGGSYSPTEPRSAFDETSGGGIPTGTAHPTDNTGSPDAVEAARNRGRQVPKGVSLPKFGLETGGNDSAAGGNGGDDDPSAKFDNRGGPQADTFRRCNRAATRDPQAWLDFCDDLDPDNSELRELCRRNAYERSPEMRKGFCRGHFSLP